MLYFNPIKSQQRIVFALFFLFTCFGFGQQVQLNSNFNSSDNGLLGDGFDKEVDKIISLTDGGYIAFGSFTQFNGKPVNGIVKLTAKGELDLSFNPNQSGADNTIKEVVVQSDGKLLVAGNFTNYNGISIKRLVRLNSDGSIDTTFNTGSGFNYMVYSIALQTDGKIIATGSFTKYKGQDVNKIIRILNNGDLDTSFSILTNPDVTPSLLVLQPDGKLLVSGDFTTLNGVTSNRLIRLNSNGTVDTTFSIGTGFDGSIAAIALDSGGKILIGGTFITYNGQSNKRVLRLNSNGSLDSSFNSGSGFSNGTVRSIVLQSNGKILLGGSFSGNYNGVGVKRILQILSNGNFDATFSIVPNGQLNSISLVKGGAVIAGDFTSVSGISKNRIAKILFCQEETVWDGTSWSNGLPTQEKAIVFKADYDIVNDTKACTCIVNSGVKVTLKNAATLELVSYFSGEGNLIFENNSSLYQTDETAVNKGIIHFRRNTTPVRKADYTYWSSPVVGQQLQLLSPNSSASTFYSFDTSSNIWQKESTNSTMILGKGYIFQPPQFFSETSPAIFEAVFSGIPNNGSIVFPIIKTINPILIGNPYPSALNADAFILENQKLLQGSLYFWTHNTPITNGKYTSDDYAVYTVLGGVGTAAKNTGINTTIPNGTIASGQAFFALGANNQEGNIVFTNAMRLSGSNHLFFKTSNSLQKVSSLPYEKHRIWLNLSNKQGLFKQILVGYATGATNGIDVLDGLSIDSNEYVDFYSLNNGEKNVIQARALPFEAWDAVSIGYRVKQEGNLTISIDSFDGLFATQNIYLEDLQEAKIQDLKQGVYSFTSASGTFDHRFVLRFQHIKVSEPSNVEVEITTKNDQVQITTSKEIINTISLYSLEGKRLYRAKQIHTKTHTIDASLWKTKGQILQIILQTGKTISRKLLLN